MKKSFVATLDQLHEMVGWIRGIAEGVGFSSMDRYKVQLAAEEAIVNVIHYSYGDKGGEILIEIDPCVERLQIMITDWGVAFNPLVRRSKAHLHGSLEERTMGGLGILFIRKCLDEVSYQRKAEQNILTLIKKVAKGS